MSNKRKPVQFTHGKQTAQLAEQSHETLEVVAVEKSTSEIQDVAIPTETETKLPVVEKQSSVKVKYSQEEIVEALNINPGLITTLEDPTKEQMLLVVEQRPGMLEFIKNQTPEVVKAALERSLSNFKFVKEQTPEMCEEVVSLDYTQMQWVKDQSTELCALALTVSPMAIAHIRNPTDRMKRYAIERYDAAIFHIKEPSAKDLETAAIHHPYVMFSPGKFEHLKEQLKPMVDAEYKLQGVKFEDVVSRRIRVPYTVMTPA